MASGSPPETQKISWDQVAITPYLQIKDGIRRRRIALQRQPTFRRNSLQFEAPEVELKGRWDESPGFGSLLSLTLTNHCDSSLRLTRLIFPTANGIDDFLQDLRPEDVSFLRNGYQSWSTARSYSLRDKPLRPWLTLVSLASSNMANLPSNTPGMLSSDMYSIITNRTTGESFLVGQSAPFDQYFYIRLNWIRIQNNASHFELVYDFGRKLVSPGETVKLDGIIMAKGETLGLQEKYFEFVGRLMKVKLPRSQPTGWSSWYFYFNKLEPADIVDNLRVLKERRLPVESVQIDDGYQQRAGDWLELRPEFEGRMRELSDRIREAGYLPGLWIAPFAAEKKSTLLKNHPEYVLRNEHGKPIVAGWNVYWSSHIYYGLDITNIRFEEYLRRVIRTVVHEWGYELLKCDFLFAGCLRGGTHNDLSCSRAEVLKRGMRIIREEAGPKVPLIGCGMPLSAGIGLVEMMRVSTDTGPYWTRAGGKLLNTAAMVGVRNALRNVMVRSPMHRRLWLNDPDCVMVRTKRTRLTAEERMAQINMAILSGGPMVFSDDLTRLSEKRLAEMSRILELSRLCAAGDSITMDLMDREIPTCFYNTSGYLGVFNPGRARSAMTFDLKRLPVTSLPAGVEDVWSGEQLPVRDGALTLRSVRRHASRLFRLET